MVGAVIGSLIGGILLAIGSFFLYKGYKNKKEQIKAIPTPGDVRNSYPQELIQIPEERTTQQPIQPQIQPIYNTSSSVQQNIDQNLLQNFRNEIIQAVREEIMQNNLRQSSRYNDNRTTRNFNQGNE